MVHAARLPHDEHFTPLRTERSLNRVHPSKADSQRMQAQHLGSTAGVCMTLGDFIATIAFSAHIISNGRLREQLPVSQAQTDH